MKNVLLINVFLVIILLLLVVISFSIIGMGSNFQAQENFVIILLIIIIVTQIFNSAIMLNLFGSMKDKNN